MKSAFTAIAIAAGIFSALPAFASTTQPPNLTITKGGKIIKTVPIFDKWTSGATLATGDLGVDGVPEVVVGAGPGSLPEIRVLRQNGTLINKFMAFDKAIAKGVIVNLLDVNGDGKNEIVAATGPKLGKFVRVFDGFGHLLNDWYPIPSDIDAIISAATVSPESSRGVDDAALHFSVPQPAFIDPDGAVSGKRIKVSLLEQRLYAYEDGYLAATYLVSTGTKSYPTKPGEYSVMKKVAVKRYVGPGYNLPNAHWNTQFSARGDYFHEAYWHNKFGQPMSHGCVNMRKDDAKFIYDWSEVGTPVIIKA